MDYDAITGMIFTIACGCVLPIYYIWQSTRQKMNETNTHTQIVLAAIEKNKETDVEDLLKKMAPMQKKTLLKEKLLLKLLWGSIIALMGLGLIGFRVLFSYTDDPNRGFLEFLSFLALLGSVLLAIGIAFLVNYFVGKNMLVKEMEAEQAKLAAEARNS